MQEHTKAPRRAWLSGLPLALWTLFKARAVKYLRKVPTKRFTRTGKPIYRYIYTDTGAARGAKQGEHLNLKKKGVHEVVHADHQHVTLRHAETGEERKITHAELHAEMASAYKKRFDAGAEKLVRQFVKQKMRADPSVDPEAAHAELADRFDEAGVSPETAKHLIGFLAGRDGWRNDAKKTLLALASDRVMGKAVSERGRTIAVGAENLARHSGAKKVRPHDVGQAAALRVPHGGFDERLAELKAKAKAELDKAETLLGALRAAGSNEAARRSMIDYAATVLEHDASHELEQLVVAFPGMRDLPEVQRLNDVRAQWRAILAERENRKPGPEGLSGADTTVYVSDAEGRPVAQKARYKIIEADDAIASHDARRGFMLHPKYPEGVQERQYHRDRAEQEKVRGNSQGLKPAYIVNTNPDAVNGPAVMTNDRIVLGGNSRVMSVQLAYADHPEAAKGYRDYLTEHAHEFGFAHSDVDRFKNPILVREVDVDDHSKGNLGVLVRRYNESFTQAMDPRVDQVARGRMVTSNMLDSIGAGMSRMNDDGEPMYSTLNDFLSSSDGRQFVQELSSAREGKSIIDRRNRSQYVSKSGHLNEDGKTFVERVLVGHVIPDPDLLSELLPSHVSAIATAVPHVVAAASKGHDVKGALKTALDAYSYMQRRQATNAKKTPITVEAYESDLGGFGAMGIEGFEQKPKLDDVSKTLFKVITEKVGKPVAFAKFFREFAQHARRNPANQATLGGESRSTKDLLDLATDRTQVGQRGLMLGSTGSWVSMSRTFGDRLWSQSLRKGATVRDAGGAQILALPEGLFKAGKGQPKAGARYIKRVPTGNTKRPWRYFYHVAHGGGVASKQHMVEGASFRHGSGHYRIHGMEDGKLLVSHSSAPDQRETMTHDELARRLSSHHADAIAEHKAKLEQERQDVRKFGSDKQRKRLGVETKAEEAEAASERRRQRAAVPGQSASWKSIYDWYRVHWKAANEDERRSFMSAAAGKYRESGAPADDADYMRVGAIESGLDMDFNQSLADADSRETHERLGVPYRQAQDVWPGATTSTWKAPAYGSHYGNLPALLGAKRNDHAAIAGLIRKDIKDAIAAGALPKGLKVSVNTRKYSGGGSIDVKVTDSPVPIFNPEHPDAPQGAGDYSVSATLPGLPSRHDERYTPAGAQIVKTLQAIHGAYNYNKSDPMTDHFDVNYYGGVTVPGLGAKAPKPVHKAGATRFGRAGMYKSTLAIALWSMFSKPVRKAGGPYIGSADYAAEAHAHGKAQQAQPKKKSLLGRIFGKGSMAKPPAGFVPIPGSKHGGYHKQVGGAWVQWYPDGTAGAERAQAKQEPAGAKTDEPKRERAKATPEHEAEAARGGTDEDKGFDVSEELKDYNLKIVGSNKERAAYVAKKMKEGLDKAADICKLSPQVCQGNLGISRDNMPQIMDKSVKDLLASSDPAEKKKGEAAVEAGADPNADGTIFDQLLDDLKSEGISVEHKRTPVGQLKATQSEIKAGKTFGMADSYFKGKFDPAEGVEIIVSKDGHILDGHHRWAALLVADPERTMRVIEVGLTMKDFLKRSFEQPGVFRADLQDNVIDDKKPVDLNDGQPFHPKRRERVTKGWGWGPWLTKASVAKEPKPTCKCMQKGAPIACNCGCKGCRKRAKKLAKAGADVLAILADLGTLAAPAPTDPADRWERMQERTSPDPNVELQQILRRTFALATDTQRAHFNVTGPNFVALHELFGEQYAELQAFVDALAERIRQRGSLVGELPSGNADTTSDDGALITSLLAQRDTLAAEIGRVAALVFPEDQATIDMLGAQQAAHEKAAWMLRSLAAIDKAGGPFIGPRGGKWADAQHTIPWQPGGQMHESTGLGKTGDLEGPYRARNGQEYFYDPKEGAYYDRGADIYWDRGSHPDDGPAWANAPKPTPKPSLSPDQESLRKLASSGDFQTHRHNAEQLHYADEALSRATIELKQHIASMGREGAKFAKELDANNGKSERFEQLRRKRAHIRADESGAKDEAIRLLMVHNRALGDARLAMNRIPPSHLGALSALSQHWHETGANPVAHTADPDYVQAARQERADLERQAAERAAGDRAMARIAADPDAIRGHRKDSRPATPEMLAHLNDRLDANQTANPGRIRASLPSDSFAHLVRANRLPEGATREHVREVHDGLDEIKRLHKPFDEPAIRKGTWVSMSRTFGANLWTRALAKGATVRGAGGAQILALPEGLFKAGKGQPKAGARYIKRVPTGNPKRPWRYFYHVAHGGGVLNKEHMKEGSRFAHGGGHYHIHGEKDGKLLVSHSKDPNDTPHPHDDVHGGVVAMTHDELAQKLSEHHGKAISEHKNKLEREHQEALRNKNQKGAAKIREEASRLGHKLTAGLEEVKGLNHHMSGTTALKAIMDDPPSKWWRQAASNIFRDMRDGVLKHADLDKESPSDMLKRVRARIASDAQAEGPPKDPEPTKEPAKDDDLDLDWSGGASKPTKPAKTDAPPKPAPKPPKHIDRALGNRSRNVARLQWTPKSEGAEHGTLRTTFHNGSVYENDDVHHADVSYVADHASPGAAFAERIKHATPSRKIRERGHGVSTQSGKPVASGGPTVELNDAAKERKEVSAKKRESAAANWAAKHQPETVKLTSTGPTLRSLDDHMDRVREVYGGNHGIEDADIDAIKKQHGEAIAKRISDGDHEGAARHVRMAVQQRMYTQRERNMSPSTADKWMRTRESKHARATAMKKGWTPDLIAIVAAAW